MESEKIEDVLDNITLSHSLRKESMAIINTPLSHFEVISSMSNKSSTFSYVFLWYLIDDNTIKVTSAQINNPNKDSFSLWEVWAKQDYCYDVKPIKDIKQECVTFKMDFSEFFKLVSGSIESQKQSSGYRTGLDNLY